MSKPNVDTPPPRNLTQELLQTYRGYANTALPYFGLESTFQPLYARLGLDIQRQNLLGYDVPQGTTPSTATPPAIQPGGRGGRGGKKGGGILANNPYPVNIGGVPNITTTPGHHPGQIELNTLQRGADVSDVAKLGPAATLAFLQANPYLWNALNNLQGRVSDSPILQTLNQQALSALQSGGKLSPEEQAAIDEQTRAAYATRGLAVSNPAVASEVLNRDAAMRQRAAAAQQLASGVQGLNFQQGDLAGRIAQIASTTLSDPFQAILGRTSGAATHPGQQIGTGARMFDPTNPYAADVYNTNFNAASAAGISNANNQAAGQNAAIGATGAIIASVLPLLFSSDKRLKKNVRSTGEKTASGLPLKTFEYKTDRKKRRYRGVMAEDVEKKFPWAVVQDEITGAKAVNYSAIDAPFDFVTGKLKAA